MRRAPRTAAMLTAFTIVTAALTLATSPVVAAELLNDGFESGTTGAWTATQNFVAQQAVVRTGSWAGRATATTQAAHATSTLATPLSEVYVRAFVDVVSHQGSTPLLRARTANGAVLASLNVNDSDELVLKNVTNGSTRSSGITLARGAFVELQLRVVVSGAAGIAEVWLDGVHVDAMSGTENFGSTPVGRVVLGRNDTGSNPLDLAFDDVVISTTFVGGGGGSTPPPTPTGLATTSITAEEVGLAWNAASGATGYTVYRDGVALATVGSPSYIDSTVQPEATYSYAVDATSGAGSSAPTAPLTVTTPPASGGGGTIVMAAGDIACDPADSNFNNGNGTASKCRQKWTGQLLTGADRVFALGDTQYECAGLSAYQQSYHPTWGQQKSITYPILSDEDYGTQGTGCGAAGPDGYFAYWGSRAGPQPSGYYSFDVAGWHVIALNSECTKVPGGCDEGSAQNNWLEQDLATTTEPCTIALLHTPRFASKRNNSQVNAAMLPFWEDLYQADTEMVLSGDSHFYERFAPQDPQGRADANGMVQWIIGVGGKSRGGLATTRRANSVRSTAQTFGVLKLTLRSAGYDWRFLSEGSSSFSDTGSASCH